MSTLILQPRDIIFEYRTYRCPIICIMNNRIINNLSDQNRLGNSRNSELAGLLVGRCYFTASYLLLGWLL